MILLFGLFWLAKSGINAVKQFSPKAHLDGGDRLQGFAWAGLVILLAGSLLDYPLRTPLAMFVTVLLSCLTYRGEPKSNSSSANARALR